jgi:hypothetical protein
MADRYSIPPSLDAERILAAVLIDHGLIWDGQGRPTGQCSACGRLRGQTIFEHQARVVRNRLVQAGLMTIHEPAG